MKPGEWIAGERRRLDMSLQDVANHLGYSKSFVHQWEKGSSPIPPKVVYKLARLFGQPPQDVWTATQPGRPFDPLMDFPDATWAAQTGGLKRDLADYFKSYQQPLPVYDAKAGQPWGWALGDMKDTTGETEYLRGHEIGSFPAPPDAVVQKGFWAKVADDSMAPTLQAGDLVLVEKLDPINGRLCFVIPTGIGKTKAPRLVRRYLRSDDGGITLAPDDRAGGHKFIPIPAPKKQDDQGRGRRYKVYRVTYLLKSNP
ncbi:MAG: LexA family transcriptional regulator [Proteobacteria bacterium]|nr:LexA family transcriptional regulator [Pseudomonadota bacterium]